MRLSKIFSVAAAVLYLTGSATPLHADAKVLQYDKSGKASIKTLKSKPRGGALPSLSKQRTTFTNDSTDPINNFEPGELLVLDPPKGFPAAIGGLGFEILEAQTLSGLGISAYRLKVPRRMTVPTARQIVASRFPGATVDANHEFESQAKRVLARTAMGWKKAHPACGAGVRIGMIDSGVDTKHPALKGQRVRFKSFHAKGMRPGPKVHGTAVASILVGKPNWGGLLPGAELLAASMFSTKKGGRKTGTAMGLLRSLSWLAKSNVHAINLSIAGTNNKTVRLAFQKAKKRGLVLAAAAGNWGRSDRPAYPAAYGHVVAVTAVGAGDLVYRRANSGKYIDFAAPGVSLYMAVPGGGKTMSGTSFASPFITAMLAVQRAKGKGRTVNALRGHLRKMSKDLGNPGKDAVFGYGRVGFNPGC